MAGSGASIALLLPCRSFSGRGARGLVATAAPHAVSSAWALGPVCLGSVTLPLAGG